MVIKYPIIVEGKYDKIKLDSIVTAKIITTDGFGIFNSKEKLLLIKRLAEKSKIILLTDSDGGGNLIRSHIKTAIPESKLINLYIPRVQGKEKRKSVPSKEGVLGVEGVSKDELLRLLAPFSEGESEPLGFEITKADFYALGLSGGDGSAKLREALTARLRLPKMSSNALLQALSILYSKEEIANLVLELQNSIK
jgi:ribonuclease M5